MAEERGNAVGWFEIPVTDMERAIKFYETVLDTKLERHQMGELDMAWFLWQENGKGAAGSLVAHPESVPSEEGTLVYFTAYSGDLENELSRVESAGGKIILPKREISPEYGFMALLLDTEGNRVALHSQK